MYAVVETGGRQFRVQTGDVLRVERLSGEVGQEIVLDRVLMVGGEDTVKWGSPLLEGACVKAEILSQARGDKILVFKFKSKKNYRRMRGHRQYYTELRIGEISLG